MEHRRVEGCLLGLFAQTSLHVGSGTALGVVDLPIQRERHTQWPTIPSSSLKGILRDYCRELVSQRDGKGRANADTAPEITALFGPPTDDPSDFAGALSLTDARLLAFPVRSLKGVFAWVTCPAVLKRLAHDLDLSTAAPTSVSQSNAHVQIPDLKQNQFVDAHDCPNVLDGGFVVLEEFDFERLPNVDHNIVSARITPLFTALLPDGEPFTDLRDRLARQTLLISDDMFTYFVRYCTEVSARIALDYETKTAREGHLFYQEFLPAESLLYSVVLANASRSGNRPGNGRDLLGNLDAMLKKVEYLQVGGNETTGKGWCAIHLANGHV